MNDDLIQTIKKLSADELEKLLQDRQLDDKIIRTLWRAALSREREARQLAREMAEIADVE